MGPTSRSSPLHPASARRAATRARETRSIPRAVQTAFHPPRGPFPREKPAIPRMGGDAGIRLPGRAVRARAECYVSMQPHSSANVKPTVAIAVIESPM
jgi:hypothetical protein